MKSIERINLLALLLEDIVKTPNAQTRAEALPALLRSPQAMARMTAFRLTLVGLVNQAYTVDGSISAREHADAVYGLIVVSVTEMATHFYEAGKRAGQAEWLDELAEMGAEK